MYFSTIFCYDIVRKLLFTVIKQRSEIHSAVILRLPQIFYRKDLPHGFLKRAIGESPLQFVLVGAGSPRPRDGKPVPYNHFTNFDAIIYNSGWIIRFPFVIVVY